MRRGDCCVIKDDLSIMSVMLSLNDANELVDGREESDDS